ncbi:hypothetical protein PV325_001804 [Microctonus aethiopoides]|uniref:DUF1279 domain-containing protein n=1 Tax=Microctonus aethiopoides TaxID=144406 RepID=A0AA39FNS4_9HYME|nr:hypothetical protein PV325_001804 [Microctonus aethiopoides]KAK0172639.1 hypothetical protein PV328_005935 [Microctonus aethiopoides]
MALSKIGCFQNSSIIFSRLNCAANVSLNDAQYLRETITPKYLKVVKTANIHFSGVRRYPEAPRLSLPNNVSEIFDNETGRFTPERARDIAAPILLYGSGSANRDNQRRAWNNDNSSSESWGSCDYATGDSHVNSYDCFSTVSLNSSMQSTVPKPFCSTGKSMHLNMPGGQWAIDDKYIAEYMQKSHYTAWKQPSMNKKYNTISSRLNYSTDSTTNVNTKQSSDKINNISSSQEKLSNREKLKMALKDYGRTVIVFHICISLMSLGACYALISSGLDVTSMLKMISISNERLESIMANSSTFLIAYAVHKVFAPVRISITLGATPFIVRYLRRIGVLKVKKS